LKIENEDSLFEFLFEYSKKWNTLSFPLFSNIYFEYLKESNLSKFFEFFSKTEIEFEIPSSIFESLSFIFKSEPRKVHKNRYSSSTANLNSISFIHSQIENLTKENKKLEKENEKLKSEISSSQNQNQENSIQKIENEIKNETEIPFCENDQNGLFSFLKRKSSESKTDLETLLKVTSSAPSHNNFLPINLLEWTIVRQFQSKDRTGGGINFELPNNSFIVKSLKILKCWLFSPIVWELRGSYDSENWTMIDRCGNDPRLQSFNCNEVSFHFENKTAFKQFRFIQIEGSYAYNKRMAIYGIELYSSLK
jgi:hypothetical protein